ncbi:hypothetical protein JTE90_022417 [Oedothorax gibbosus]|uniref:TTF-type domain-containing protein n=1 Tax=Oedothorax gibbosus TaxID=931172 RepID=A0AAV6U442_9ARAC|nr:hypothetical protein JTE90_022417 [Oedothorax gibbosus]
MYNRNNSKSCPHIDVNLFHKNHPTSSFKFPKDGNRSCQFSWFKQFPWLHYDEQSDYVLCYEFIKSQAFRQEFSQNMEKAFLSVGFRKWKNGVQSLKKHEKSDYHQQSVHINVQRAEKPPITTLLSSQIKKDQEEARAALRVIISSLRYLVRTGQATRGHEHDGEQLAKRGHSE